MQQLTKPCNQSYMYAVVVEADWPDAFRANLFVRGLGSDKNADEALSEFKVGGKMPGCRMQQP